MTETEAIHPLPHGSSSRLMLATELAIGIAVSKIEVIGKERLSNLPPQIPIIVAFSHISDLDGGLALLALGHDLDLVVTDMSIHHKLWASLRSSDWTIAGILIAGRKNFLPITFVQEQGYRQGRIISSDLDRIQEKLEAGKAVLIAAHNPTSESKLPDKPGYAAIRVAQAVENALVVPVAVEVGDGERQLGLAENLVETIRRRPAAKVIVGDPLTFNNPLAKKAAAVIEDILNKRGANLTVADKEQIRMARKTVDAEGARLMRALAVMLPSEKRGRWGV